MLNFLFGADGMGRDVFAVLSDINSGISSFAGKVHLPSLVTFLIGVVLAVFLGVCGYRFIKLFMSLSFGAIGYCIGVELTAFVNSKLTNYVLLSWMQYVIGAVVALLFLALAFRKFSYVMFAEIALVGISTGLFYTDGNKLLALGTGLLLALISVYLVRWVFIAVSSVIGAFLAVDFLSQVIDVAFLKLDTSFVALFIALGVALVFIVIQLVSTQKLVFRRRR